MTAPIDMASFPSWRLILCGIGRHKFNAIGCAGLVAPRSIEQCAVCGYGKIDDPVGARWWYSPEQISIAKFKATKP